MSYKIIVRNNIKSKVSIDDIMYILCLDVKLYYKRLIRLIVVLRLFVLILVILCSLLWKWHHTLSCTIICLCCSVLLVQKVAVALPLYLIHLVDCCLVRVFVMREGESTTCHVINIHWCQLLHVRHQTNAHCSHYLCVCDVSKSKEYDTSLQLINQYLRGRANMRSAGVSCTTAGC